MGDLATFDTRNNGLSRVWVPGGEESDYIRMFGRMGIAAARWSDYIAWGRQFYPPTVSADVVMSGRKRRARRTYGPPRGY